MEPFFNDVIENAYDNAVGTKNEHRTNGNESDKSDMNAVKTAAEVYDANNGKEIHHVIKHDVAYEIFFVDVPIEKGNAEE